jgi:anti-anti-sigma factor
MDINERRVRDVLIVGMTGMLDTLTARDTEPRLLNMIKDDDRRVLLNLGKLTYLSSAGLRVILQAAKLLKNRTGELRICNVSDNVKNVLNISGFHYMIKIYDTEAEAFAAPWQYR